MGLKSEAVMGHSLPLVGTGYTLDPISRSRVPDADSTARRIWRGRTAQESSPTARWGSARAAVTCRPGGALADREAGAVVVSSPPPPLGARRDRRRRRPRG